MEAQMPAVGLLGSSRDELKILRLVDHTRQMAHPGWPYPVTGDWPTARRINFSDYFSVCSWNWKATRNKITPEK
jgi:hypothetical protein